MTGLYREMTVRRARRRPQKNRTVKISALTSEIPISSAHLANPRRRMPSGLRNYARWNLRKPKTQTQPLGRGLKRFEEGVGREGGETTTRRPSVNLMEHPQDPNVRFSSLYGLPSNNERDFPPRFSREGCGAVGCHGPL